MGVLSRFEERLGGAVEGGFGRVFRSKVEPVELAAALKKEADTRRVVGAGRTHVPNRYEIDLGPSDYERLSPYRYTLGDELATMLREHAGEQRYEFVGPVEVTLVRDEALRTGSYRVGSAVEESRRAAAEAYAPPAAPAAATLPPPTAAFDAGLTAPIDRPAAPRAHLELPGGEHVPVADRPLVLGRGHEADVRLADASVSRKHAVVRLEGGRVVVEDLGSTNGTTVNGERVARAALVDGDRLTLGSAKLAFRSAG